MRKFIIFVLLATMHSAARAGEADVLDVKVSCNNKSICRFAVTVQHDDDGWKHYANRWEVLGPDGKVIATRVLAHPHSKKPFTRSLDNVKIPAGVTEVRVRAHDLVHGYGGKEMVVKLPLADDGT